MAASRNNLWRIVAAFALLVLIEGSARAADPVITSGPADLYPDSTIKLTGSNFTGGGTFHIHFPSASATPFANGEKNHLALPAPRWGTNTGTAQNPFNPAVVESEKITDASPVGAVPAQTVEITVTTEGNLTSNVWHAKFHNNADITECPKKVVPGQNFTLKGWDFGAETPSSSQIGGKVTVHFPTKGMGQVNNPPDRVIEVPTRSWLPDSVLVGLPMVTGAVAQTVDITLETTDGRKSNTCKAQFEPRNELVLLPWNARGALAYGCGNDSESDSCNDPSTFNNGTCGFRTVLPGVLDSGFTMMADHYGCWGFDSDNATDTYMAAPVNGWKIQGFAIDGVQNNGSMSWTSTPAASGATGPSSFVPIVSDTSGDDPVYLYNLESHLNWSVSWHIGADGGEVQYFGYVYIVGPKGVSYAPTPWQ
jgi:hypothetical protein